MSPSLAVGEWAKPSGDVSRSPCPVVNALANHGYIERSGRKIFVEDLNASMKHVGMSSLLGSVFAVPTYFEYHNKFTAIATKPVSMWKKIWTVIKDPYTIFSYFGCWKPGQMTSDGRKYINLVDLASHGAIEHDISLSRRDFSQQQGNNEPQQDLIDNMLDYSFDGEFLTIEDLGMFIKARIKQQLADNPQLVYGPDDHQVNCGQIALMMGCFGDGKKIPVSYVRAIFRDERLPIEEGWKKRSWWRSMGIFEFFPAVKRMITTVGMNF